MSDGYTSNPAWRGSAPVRGKGCEQRHCKRGEGENRVEAIRVPSTSAPKGTSARATPSVRAPGSITPRPALTARRAAAIASGKERGKSVVEREVSVDPRAARLRG